MITPPARASRRGGRRREDVLDGVPDLVDLLEGGQEVHRAGLLPVVELLAVEVDLEPAAVGRGEGDRGLPVVDRRQLGRHTDGHGEIPSDDAVDDLDVHLPFGHGVLLWIWWTACYRYPRGGAITASRTPPRRGGTSRMASGTDTLRVRHCRGADIAAEGAFPAGDVLLARRSHSRGARYLLAMPDVALAGETLTDFLARVAPHGCPAPPSLIRAYSLPDAPFPSILLKEH